jgi:hypothetical protein
MARARSIRRFVVMTGACVVAIAGAFVCAGCVTVKPQQRALLSDPIMRVGGSPHDLSEAGHLNHALESREGSAGGEGVAGGGCGCN